MTKTPRALLIFLDGIGLGVDDPTLNPFAAAHTPTLWALAGGQKWLREAAPAETERSLFIPTDPRLGLPGRPQSATGQATIITGRNVPAEIGEHYGPYPTARIREIVDESSLFKRLAARGRRVGYLAAYPPGLHAAIARGKRLRTSLQHAAFVGGAPLGTVEDMYAGRALSADFTGQGWRDVLGISDMPTLTPHESGARLAALAKQYDFSLFSTWITDEIGHRGPLERGIAILESFDQVMSGLLETWRDEDGLIVLTSDHGNMEDVSIRQHTENNVPTLVIGQGRHMFKGVVKDLTDLAPRIDLLLGGANENASAPPL